MRIGRGIPQFSLSVFLVLGIFLAGSALGCKSKKIKKSKLLIQEENLVSFQIYPREVDRIFKPTRITIAPDSCRGFTGEDFRLLFSSLRDQNPSLFGSKDRPVFPIGSELVTFVEEIQRSIATVEGYPEFLFFIWKEDDPMNPFTRIRRTTFYLFCEKDRMSLVFGEWKKDIAFQKQYTFSEWITAPRFQVQQTGKKRFFLVDNVDERIQFNVERVENQSVIYHDWILLYKTGAKLPSYLTNPNPANKKNNSGTKLDSLGERFKTLEELKRNGLINEEEYNQKRKELLDSL